MDSMLYKTKFFHFLPGREIDELPPDPDRYRQCQRMAIAGVPEDIQRDLILSYWSSTGNAEVFLGYNVQGMELAKAEQLRTWYNDVQDAINDAREKERALKEEEWHREHMRKFAWYIFWSAMAVLIALIALGKSFGIFDNIVKLLS